MFVGIILKPYYCAKTLMGWSGERTFNKFSRLSILTPWSSEKPSFSKWTDISVIGRKGVINFLVLAEKHPGLHSTGILPMLCNFSTNLNFFTCAIRNYISSSVITNNIVWNLTCNHNYRSIVGVPIPDHPQNKDFLYLNISMCYGPGEWHWQVHWIWSWTHV